MRWVVVVESPSQELSGFGEVVGGWVQAGVDRAAIQPTSGSNGEAGLPQRESINWYDITTRYNVEIRPGRRLVVEGEPYSGKTIYIADVQYELGLTKAKGFERLAG